MLAYFQTEGLSNGGTKAFHMLVEKARRLTHAYRIFNNYRPRCSSRASDRRTRRVKIETANHAQVLRGHQGAQPLDVQSTT